MLKVKDTILVYQDKEFYSAFPGAAALGGGRIALVFRRAPRYRGMPGLPYAWHTHLDRNSQLMLTFSNDNGVTWEKPSLLYAPSCGAAQDGGMYFDGKYLYANTFVWGNLPDAVLDELRRTGQDEFIYSFGGSNVATHIGSVSFRSADLGRTWEGPFHPDPLPGDLEALPGMPLRMHNRANIIRSPKGTLLFPGQALRYRPKYLSSVVLYESTDDGLTWHYLSTVADHRGEGVFEEPCLCITPSGKYVMFIRTHRGYDGVHKQRAELFTCESLDGGRTWSEPHPTGVHGEPATACQLEDGRYMVAYGYRKPPEGVRARICNSELTDFEVAEEFVLRDDVGYADVGYPWIVPLGGNKYMVFHYANKHEYDGNSGIFGIVVEVD